MSLAPMLAQTKHPNVDLVAFRFQVEGTSDPDNLFPGYQGVTNVTRSGTGEFTITFDFKYPFMLCCMGSVQSAVGVTAGAVVKVISYTASTGVLIISVVAADDGDAADPADEGWVHVFAVMARQTGAYATVAI